MPVNLQELVRAIDQRMPEIRMMSEQQRDHANRGEDLVRELNGLDLDGFVSRLPPEPKGALPMLEGNETGLDWRLLREFREEFTDMVGAREWARAILSNRSVGAVDGSQIFPGNELSLPFGLVNIGWYINHHDGNYTTDHSSRLLLPDDLGYNPDSGVNLLRERGEIDKLRELFGSSGKGDLLLLDGSLVLSYALHVFDTTRDSYINGILSLLETIGQEDGPLFAAYIDNSRATDLSTMLGPLLTTRSKLIEEGGEKEGNGEVSHVEGRKEEMVVDEERKGVVKEGEMGVDEKRRGMVKEGEMVVDEKRREVVNEGEMVVVDEGRKGVVKEGEMVVDEERKEVVKEGEMVVVDEGRKEGGEDSVDRRMLFFSTDPWNGGTGPRPSSVPGTTSSSTTSRETGTVHGTSCSSISRPHWDGWRGWSSRGGSRTRGGWRSLRTLSGPRPSSGAGTPMPWTRRIMKRM